MHVNEDRGLHVNSDKDDDNIMKMMMDGDDADIDDSIDNNINSIEYNIDDDIINGRYGSPTTTRSFNSDDDNNNRTISDHSTRRNYKDRLNDTVDMDVSNSGGDGNSDIVDGGIIMGESRIPIRGVQRMMFKSMTRSLEV